MRRGEGRALTHRASQLEALLRKNATLTWRNKPAAFVQFIATFIFILLIYGVSEAIQQADSKTATYKTIITPSSYAVPSIPDCGFSVRCTAH